MRDDAEVLRETLRDLGIDPALPAQRGLQPHPEARRLTPAGLGADGRDKLLTPAAAHAWASMRWCAATDEVELQLVSAFRSVAFQAALIRGKLQRGLGLDAILRVNAPPGYSEHHSGRAVDIGTPGVEPLDAAFEHTDAYAWLRENAAQFGFHLSYPRDNPQGYLYEPWHWCYRSGTRRKG